MKIGVIMGGVSRERAISVRSGERVLAALLRLGHEAFALDPIHGMAWHPASMDVAFIALHGTMGEDGGIQAYLETLGIPYTGSGISASVLAMNKLLSKHVYDSLGIRTSPYVVLTPDHTECPLAFPLVIKPISEGSSLGVHVVHDATAFTVALTETFHTFQACLCERYVAGTEISVGVLDHANGPLALPVLGLKPSHEFYDFDAKYTHGKTQFECPAALPPDVTQAAQDMALAAHVGLGCAGMSRSDMIVGPDGVVILETNTIPGLTDLSDLPAQAATFGIGFDQLIEGLVQHAHAKAHG